jgi:hypothetical protein
MGDHPIVAIPPEAMKYMVSGTKFDTEAAAHIHRELLAAIDQFSAAVSRLIFAIGAKCKTADGFMFDPSERTYFYITDDDWPTIKPIQVHAGRYYLQLNEDENLEIVEPHPEILGGTLKLEIQSLYAEASNAIAAMATKREADIAWRRAHINQA